MARAFSPVLNSMDTLTLHVANTGGVTWSMESSDGGCVNRDFLVERRKVRNITSTQIRVVLFVDEFLDQPCEPRFINIFWVNVFHCLSLILV